MAAAPVTEGEVAFEAPNAGKPCKTWYKVHGSLEDTSSPALIALHGGPGAGHEYLSPLEGLYEQHRIPVVFYDQVGCGRSTHFREKAGDTSFWTFDLFIAELDNLIDHLKLRERGFYVLGQSWGGMFGAIYATRRPVGLKKLVIASSPASVPLYVVGNAQLRSALPGDMCKVLETADHDSPEYKEASHYFYSQHVYRLDPLPEHVSQAFKNLEDDPTAYHTMQGPSELVITGTLKDWEGWKVADEIKVDSLVLNGRYDEMTDICVAPWFKAIPRVKWVTFEKASHMAHWEDTERFLEVCGSFLVD
ncbi:proline-specific peptidase [Xylariomycetidae sp. FL0641]|nr:proline-specific peptidase [Xylariomycetidae sp. FL0641]